MCCCVALQPAIQLKDFLRRALGEKHLRLWRVVVYGQHRREHDVDLAGMGEVGHRGVVRLDVFEAHGAGIAGDIVGAGENDHYPRMKLDHILAEAD